MSLPELRQNFFKFYDAPQRFNPENGEPLFEFQTDENLRIILPTEPGLLSQVDRLRKRVVHCFRLRGTSGNFMEQARQAGTLSAKKVDMWFEDDVDSIATYRVPTADMRIPTDEFLYRLQLTATNALRYAMRHGEWDYMLLSSDREDSIAERTAAARKIFENDNHPLKLANHVELAACYETPFYPVRQSLLVDYMTRGFQTNRRFYSYQTGGNYIDETGYKGGIRIWDKPVQGFLESGFRPDYPIGEYSPLYTQVKKTEVLKTLDQLDQPNSPERQLLDRMASQVPDGKGLIHDTVLYLMGETVTLNLLDTLQAWAHDNEPYLQFTEI